MTTPSDRGILHLADLDADGHDSVASTGIPDTVFDAKGDLLAASAADTAARLAVGADDADLIGLASASTGLAWRRNTATAADPTVNDDSGDGYRVLSVWVNTSSGEAFVCVDATASAAVWLSTTGGFFDDASLFNYVSVTTIGLSAADGAAAADGYGAFLAAGQADNGSGATGASLSVNGGVNATGDGGDINLTPGLLSGAGRNGLVILENLPTSSPGVTGALWNDGGTLKVSA